MNLKKKKLSIRNIEQKKIRVTYADIVKKDCKMISNDTRDIVGRRNPSILHTIRRARQE